MRPAPPWSGPFTRFGTASVLLILGVATACGIGVAMAQTRSAGAGATTAGIPGQVPGLPSDDVTSALTPGPGQATARARLRRLGPEALELVQQAESRHPLLASPETWDALYDQVAAQRDACSSRLYWYTDLAQAQQAARQAHRPILSLRLLGALTDEYSCANSRLFRALVYPDPALQAYLRAHCILYWSSERPVPQVTIDLGDGRTLHSTLGGNSVHYLLDDHLRVLDAFPGLYAPQAFLAGLNAAVELNARISAAPLQRAELIADYHRQQLAARAHRLDVEGIPFQDVAFHLDPSRASAFDRFTRAATGTVLTEPRKELDDLLLLERQLTWTAASGASPSAAPNSGPLSGWRADAQVPIAEAEAITMSKLAIEMPMLRAVGIGDPPLRALLPQQDLERLSQDYLQQLDPRGCSVLDRQLGELRELSHNVLPVGIMHGMIALEMAKDTAVDEVVLHAAIHDYLLGRPDATWEELNHWMYASLFLTPREDSWLGLVPLRFDGIDHHLGAR